MHIFPRVKQRKKDSTFGVKTSVQKVIFATDTGKVNQDMIEFGKSNSIIQ